ncbi:VPLPA-CTERM sorting domain-containing protein [Parvularcula sp. LCG005]|uniref:VPLPA-CTERM sorting domain-containing protein n=1 Tax=Parvularcula sp. LCG005 TaxID=3078805 RepID=UPI0029423AE4|nr:VPLPA-CTERM sorting domain-containing protein [Parvularcula sp. LCG005]WOI54162.1 VPLPA-CTERM sorting domain-containing protein [Parvularcula sp. LCG005]
MKSLIAAGASALLLAASSAFAGTMTFGTMTPTSSTKSSKTYDDAGVTVTAQGVYWSQSGTSGSVWSDSDISLYSHSNYGFYVQNTDEYTCYYYFYCYGTDQHTVDGQGRPEAVMFTFSEEVVLNDIQFATSYLDYQDGFSLLTSNGFGGWDVARYNGVKSATGSTGIFSNFGMEIVGRSFIIAAKGTDDFKIRALSYSLPTSEVPLPAALPLMAAGLAGLGFTRRKAKANSAA